MHEVQFLASIDYTILKKQKLYHEGKISKIRRAHIVKLLETKRGMRSAHSRKQAKKQAKKQTLNKKQTQTKISKKFPNLAGYCTRHTTDIHF